MSSGQDKRPGNARVPIPDDLRAHLEPARQEEGPDAGESVDPADDRARLISIAVFVAYLIGLGAVCAFLWSSWSDGVGAIKRRTDPKPPVERPLDPRSNPSAG